MAFGGNGNSNPWGCDAGNGAGGLFTSPQNLCFGLGGSDFSPFGLNPEAIDAGLIELLPQAAPFLFQMAENFDEKMIDEPIRLSMGDTGTGSGSGPKPEAGTSKRMTTNNPRSAKNNNGKTYRLDIVLGSDTQPESLKIIRKDNIMTIDVKKEKSTQSEDGSLASQLYQEFTEKVALPDNVDLSKLESVLSPDGVLTIQAPFFPEPEEANKAVPAPVVQSTPIPVLIEDEDQLPASKTQ